MPTPTTPMMKQYQEAKRACPDALLLFRMGDFYELFYDDAKIAARTVNLALTSREKGAGAVPMAGFPHHQLESYLGKLIAAGDVADIKRDEAEVVRIGVDDPGRASALLDGQPWVSAVSADGDRLRVRMAHHRAADANALLVEAGLRVWALEPEQRSLEEAFLALMNGSSDG